MPNDSYMHSSSSKSHRDNRNGRVTIAFIIISAVIAIMFTASLLNADTTSEFRAPVLSLRGGELPKVDIDAAETNLDTNKIIVDAPTIEVDSADASAEG